MEGSDKDGECNAHEDQKTEEETRSYPTLIYDLACLRVDTPGHESVHLLVLILDCTNPPSPTSTICVQIATKHITHLINR